MPTRLLTKSDIAAVLPMSACIDAVEAAFLAHANGETIPPGVLGTHVHGGGFHVKTAGMTTSRAYYVAKVNANFPDNPRLRNLPTVQGALLLYDAEDGSLLAVMDSAEITRLRTAAASAVAARHLSRPDSAVMTICGCGLQGRAHVEAILAVRPIQRILACDAHADAAASFAHDMRGAYRIDVQTVASPADGARVSDIVVTCTSSRHAILSLADLRPGTFVAAVGADSDAKRELAGDILAGTTVVADIREQCATIGDLHHAIAEGRMTARDIHGELADVISGRVPGRRFTEEITVFDSTGTALEDVAAAAWAYERAAQVIEIDLAH
jgi:ornithine cyclodeaminase/alanine dehydrogenase-like protein (mu-crystallin family)